MITLTTPAKVATVLGSSALTNYDRLDLITIHYDVLNKAISGQCQLVASGNAQATAIQGSFSIPTSGQAILTISIPTLPFYASIALTSAQQATVAGWIASAQNTVEAGLVSVGVAAGTQSAGV